MNKPIPEKLDATRKESEDSALRKSSDSEIWQKRQRMFEKVLHSAEEIIKYALLAMLEPDIKKGDKAINKIIDLTERIEEQYSTNWH